MIPPQEDRRKKFHKAGSGGSSNSGASPAARATCSCRRGSCSRMLRTPGAGAPRLREQWTLQDLFLQAAHNRAEASGESRPPRLPPTVTRTVIQALKTLGRNGASDEAVSALARNLTDEDANTLLKESKGLTSLITEVAKRIWRERHDG